MIRPFTCLVFLLACGSGLYLYQSKHRVKLLDERIAQTVQSTDALRAQTRMLSAEWTLLNDPERLRQLASQFLTLQTVSPNQFTSLADLDSRLPPPAPPAPPPGTTVDAEDATPSGQDQVPVAANAPGQAGEDEGQPAHTRAADAKPADAKPPGTRQADARPNDARPADARTANGRSADARTADARLNDARSPDTRSSDARMTEALASKAAAGPAAAGASSGAALPATAWSGARNAPAVAAEQARTAERKAVVARVSTGGAQPHLVVGLARTPDPRGPDQRTLRAADPRGVDPRFAAARSMAPPPRVAPLPQSGGSLLGMAHGMGSPPAPVPLPRPMPVNAAQWSYTNGG
jgi:hypothetical protein